MHAGISDRAREEGLTTKQWLINVLTTHVEIGDISALLKTAISSVVPESSLHIERKGPGTFLLRWKQGSEEKEVLIQGGKRYKPDL